MDLAGQDSKLLLARIKTRLDADGIDAHADQHRAKA
jgi:hypothetical protein